MRLRRSTLCIGLLAAIAIPRWSSGQEGQVRGLEPQLAELLELRTEGEDLAIQNGKYKSPFFVTLIMLAEKSRVNPEAYLRYDSGSPALSGVAWAALTSGKAVEIESHKNRYVVAILSAPMAGIPDTAIQQLVLLGPKGQFLDKVACAINSRYGTLKTDVKKDSESDGAHLIVRFYPGSLNKTPWHNWHTITCEGKAFTFREPFAQPQEDWLKKGLCRIAIRDGKFAVVFPKLEKSDAEVLKEKSAK